MNSEGEGDSSYASSRDASSSSDDDAESTTSSTGFIGVRALQPTTADLDRYRLRDYPLGSAFAFDVRPGGGIAAKITLTAGARLHISSATIVEADDDDDNDDEDSSDGEDNKKDSKRSSVKRAALTINMPGDTAESPYPDDEDYDGAGPDGASMVLWDYRAGESRTITGLGVSVSGPTSLSLGVRCRLASSLRSINVFGSVVLDDQVVSYGLDSDDDNDDEGDAYYAEEEDGEYFEEEKYWGIPLDEQERDLMRQLMDDERAELEREAADNDALMGEEGVDDEEGDDAANAAKRTKSKKKRKMSADRDDALDNDNKEGEVKPLSKKQRKKLAQKKAQELADAVAKEQGHDVKQGEDDGDEKKKSKKKKKGKDKEEVPTKSLTRERRIEGGVVVQDVIIGVGQAVKPGRKVSINYEGSLASDGSVFDKNKSKSSPLSFRPGTGEVIKGLDKGMEGMKVGGERIITIPPALAYGKKGNAMIPKNSTLVFTVKLLGVGGR